MSYHVTITRSAEKELDRIPQKFAEHIEQGLESLAGNPRPRQSKKLKNTDYFRFRVGNYRVVYQINDQKREILVVRIAHRKEAYR